MPLEIQNITNLLAVAEIESLWQVTLAYTKIDDQDVTIRFIEENEIRQLNREHRGKDTPTNILTFNYGDSVHDVAVCEAVVEREATERNLPARDYLALVLVHGFLHVASLDHERSEEEAKKTSEAEQEILKQAGFTAQSL